MKNTGKSNVVEGGRGVSAARALDRFGDRGRNVGESIIVLASERADDRHNYMAKPLLAHVRKDSVEFSVVREAMYEEWFAGKQKRDERAHLVQRLQQVGATGSASHKIDDV